MGYESVPTNWSGLQVALREGDQQGGPSQVLQEDSDSGLILEVDLEYPKELHYLHNDYSLAPEQLLLEDDMLSDYRLEAY